MDAIELLLHQFDNNLKHPWESLESLLKNVTADEASWQAPCYAQEELQQNGPPPGTILWQLNHLSGCNRHYVEVLRNRPEKDFPEAAPGSPLTTFSAALEELRASHAALRAEVSKVKAGELKDACGHGSRNVADFIAGCLRHEIWHAGSMVLIRRLYRAK